jgi:hypothetical protein
MLAGRARASSSSGSGGAENAPYGDFRFGRDFSGVFSVPSNVFLMKFSYWLNY